MALGERIIPDIELERLGSLLSYLIVLRERARPVQNLHRTIQDIRCQIQHIITRYYLPLSKEKEGRFIGEIIDFLCDIRIDIIDEGLDEDFCDYCVGKVISSFERAVKIKKWTHRGEAQAEILSSLPIMEKFDLKLKSFIKLVRQEPASKAGA